MKWKAKAETSDSQKSIPISSFLRSSNSCIPGSALELLGYDMYLLDNSILNETASLIPAAFFLCSGQACEPESVKGWNIIEKQSAHNTRSHDAVRSAPPCTVYAYR